MQLCSDEGQAVMKECGGDTEKICIALYEKSGEGETFEMYWVRFDLNTFENNFFDLYNFDGTALTSMPRCSSRKSFPLCR